MEEALSIQKEAFALEKQGNFLDAIDKLETIDSPLLDSLPVLDAKVRLGKGMNYYGMGEYNIATRYFLQSLNLMELVEADSLERADLCKVIGNSYMLVSMMDSSFYYFESAISLLGTKANYKNYAYLGSAYHNIANAYEQVKDIQNALLYMNRSINIWEIFQDGPSIEKVMSYGNVSRLHQSQQEFSKAESYMQKSTQIVEQLGPKQAPAKRFLYMELGGFYARSGNYEKAIEYGTKALDLHTQLLPPDHIELAVNYNNLGYTSILFDRYKEAVSYLQSALEIYHNAYRDKRHFETARTYVNLGIAYRKLGDYPQAIEAYQQALFQLNYEEKSGKDFSEVSALDLVVWSCEDLGETYYQWYIETQSRTHLHTADKYFSKAIDAIVSLRQNMKENESQQLWYSQKYTTFEHAIKVKYELADNSNSEEVSALYTDIFKLMEMGKGIFLLEAFRKSRALQIANIPDDFIQQETSLKRKIEYYRKQYIRFSTGTDSSLNPQLAFSLDQYMQAKQSYEQWIKNLQRKYPDYFRLTHQTTPVSLETVQKRLSPNQYLVEYMAGDSALYIAVVSPNRIDIEKIPLDFPLARWAEELRAGIYAQDPKVSMRITKKDSLIQMYEDRAFQLYQRMLAPISEELSEASQLLIVPDGALGYVPFDALFTQPIENADNYHTAPFLIREFNISYAHSATLWLEMLEKEIHPQKWIAAFAPTFPKSPYEQQIAQKVPKKKEDSNRLYELEFSQEEVEGIRQLWDASLFLGPKASLQHFLAEAGQYRVLHLSTHGNADDRVGDFCFLAFTDIQDTTENGELLENLLYVRDLYPLKLNAEMVVLSACLSGYGELQRGEGILSMSQGFSYAGAKSIISTLWQVDEYETKGLMVTFYEHLKKGLPKHEALRIAKLAHLKNPQTALPYYWAAFTANGDMRPIERKQGNWGYFLGVALVILMSIWGLRRMRRNDS